MRRALVLAVITSAALAGTASAEVHRFAPSAPVHAPTTLLVTPGGQPVGGRWQLWANEARVPTVTATVILTTPAAMGCVSQQGCSERPFGATLGAIAAADRSALYFELGHQFDWRYLTGADRKAFARLWGVPRDHWVDSVRSVEHGGENGLEAVFAQAYMKCAADGSFYGVQWIVGDGPNAPNVAVVRRTAKGLVPRPRATCKLIRAIRR